MGLIQQPIPKQIQKECTHYNKPHRSKFSPDKGQSDQKIDYEDLLRRLNLCQTFNRTR